ncbi:hypothetical protein B0J15DRAFT_107911 [Fusarium solani]|uniref:Uncharacterized protein n=1 Tax=Fusarium solani TaxID=169388 RepID=A0A9P9RC91_FUSSL|nr:uncharacterized protein B0J15DRAFT_107911 [Fusarium solani]KAH7273697.1 hypothetical protein B0J15DRAFT_107911 [Fusarium solani]
MPLLNHCASFISFLCPEQKFSTLLLCIARFQQATQAATGDLLLPETLKSAARWAASNKPSIAACWSAGQVDHREKEGRGLWHLIRSRSDPAAPALHAHPALDLFALLAWRLGLEGKEPPHDAHPLSWDHLLSMRATDIHQVSRHKCPFLFSFLFLTPLCSSLFIPFFCLLLLLPS